MTCNTSSSNISGTPIAGEVTQVGSQLKVDVVQASHGFTAGRFDVGMSSWRRPWTGDNAHQRCDTNPSLPGHSNRGSSSPKRPNTIG